MEKPPSLFVSLRMTFEEKARLQHDWLRWPGSKVGCRHQLHLDSRRMAISCHRARSLLPAHHRLGRQRPVKEGSRAECVAPCNHNPPAIRRTDPSFRPGQPILFRGLSETSGLPGNHRIHERQGELLRQRHGGNRLQNHQIRSGLADKIPDKGGCRIGPWPLH